MSAKCLMFQGTGSNVGKSILVTGLCRAAKSRGIKVAPFKPQNMSNNAAVCPDGGEIGRAQALQARACGLVPDVKFNPVLLKPQTDQASQLVVNGEVRGAFQARQFFGAEREVLLPDVLNSFQALRDSYDLVLVEGAGSPAETNLRDGDIANMGFATAAQVPVCLIADIERGGSIASLVGTQTVLDRADQSLIKSFIINKFRGDPKLFDEGLEEICQRTGWTSYGVVPWLKETTQLPEEDAVPLDETSRTDKAGLKIAAPMLSRIANFDDLDPLIQEPDVNVDFIPPGTPIPLDSDVVILLGTKSALGDMQFLKQQGWDIDIQALARHGRTILGVCGGLQLLGKTLRDPEGIDGSPGSESGLGLLDIETSMRSGKTLRETKGQHLVSGASISGYEIHVGETSGRDALRPFAETEFGPDGACNQAGNISGTYLHGLFTNDEFRSAWLASLREGHTSQLRYEQSVEEALDQLAASLEDCLDIDQLLADAS